VAGPQDSKQDSPEGKNYKDTVQLPKTDFPMKGNLPQTEPVMIQNWTAQSLYKKMITGKAKKFVMPDGPPYANGNIHIGHVLNKVLKDIVIKYKNMQGFQAEFIPGWDCHGLPIELKVTSALGDKKNSMTKKEIRSLCRKEAQKWINHQREQFIRLGILADWENPYLTMQPQYEAGEVRVLAKINDNGVFFRGNKPVYWCPALQTALAAAEIEYHDHKSLSIYTKFYVKDNNANVTNSASPSGKPSAPLKGLTKPTAFVIWTTTPWTLPANFAIALNANFTYGAFDIGSEILILATELAESVSKDTGVQLGKPIKTWKGAELEKLNAEHPFMNRPSLIILGDHVTLEAGTGCVHTAPGHGIDDYHVGLKYDLPVYSPVDPAGKYTSDIKMYEGLSIWKANPIIVEDLKKSNHLLGVKEIVHSYPHNPRSKTPLIFRATPQWFIRMEDDYHLRDKTLNAVENEIQYFPDWGKARLKAMVSNTPDWCLSRQRTWGVPIPVFFCNSCGEALAKSSVMNRVADEIAKNPEGIEAYFDLPVETFSKGEKCDKCGKTEFSRSEDILDVWFDSGVCHTSVHVGRLGLKEKEPADIYLEGSDQHRGWFQTSLISSVAAYGISPYKALITHGFVNDAQGFKMSKSKGNVIDPAEVIKKYGAEVLRLWVAHEDYGDDVTVSDDMFQRVSETYRRIRNTMRFLLGNLSDFNPETDRVPFKKMPPLDRWALCHLNNTIKEVTAAYEGYDFFKVYHNLNVLFTVDLSAFYLDVLKDRLYTGKANGVKRRASQTVLYELLSNLTRMLAPILSFLAEETHRYLPGKKSDSVFLETFPKVSSEWVEPGLDDLFKDLMQIKESASKQLEELRRNKVIGSSLDARVIIPQKKEWTKVLTSPVFGSTEAERLDFLREVLITSQVAIDNQNTASHVEVVAEKAKGEKCVRCWNYNENLNSSSEHANVCPKCVEALG
jgi:isoleucyl-tRNA synthetase